jgi:hypothetical protein
VLPRPVQRTGLLRRAVPVDEPAVADGAPAAGGAPADDGTPLPRLDGLVDAVNTAGFAPEAADAGQAQRAGDEVVAYAAALRERRSWWRRLWWSVHPGPLRWNRRPGGGLRS